MINWQQEYNEGKITETTNGNFFVEWLQYMLVLTIGILETTGGIVVEGGDSWWSSMLLESAGSRRCCRDSCMIVVVSRETTGWSLSLVESVGWSSSLVGRQLNDQCPGCTVRWFNWMCVDVVLSVDASPCSESFIVGRVSWWSSSSVETAGWLVSRLV